MDCQDLLETERIRTEILNVADSKRPAQDSVPVKDEGQKIGRANKAVERRECCKSAQRWETVGQGKSSKDEQWRKAPEWRGDNQGGAVLVS